MKNSLRRLTAIAVFLIFLLVFCLSGLIWLTDIQPQIKAAAIILTVSIFTVCALFFWLISKQVNKTLEALSETIQHMIDESSGDAFTELEDTMLSKLQSQIVKLSDILKSHSLRQREEKESIKALISDISHQLKTPLTNLQLYNDFLLDPKLPSDKRHAFTQNMQSQIEKLNWLMESLLKLSRLETGIINLNITRKPISQTILQAIRMVYLKAEQKQMSISFEGDESLQISHDPTWTQEAIFNVLDNAVKYSPAGTEISVTLSQFELFCRIDIADKGSGIPESEYAKIFQRFYRGENAQNSEGVGIGLFLSRKIISEQGGYMKVRSEIGSGTVFSVFLPLIT